MNNDLFIRWVLIECSAQIAVEHLTELTKFLVGQGWNEYGGVRIMVNPDNPGGDKLYLQPMVVYDKEKLE